MGHKSMVSERLCVMWTDLKIILQKLGIIIIIVTSYAEELETDILGR